MRPRQPGRWAFPLLTTLLLLTGSAWAGTSYRVLHNFNCTANDGCGLYVPLTFDQKGTLYGATDAGGTYRGGTVFKLSPSARGSWREKLLHSLNYHTEGAYIRGHLVLDGGGAVYGATTAGGPQSAGTVFELTPGLGGWTFNILYGSFGSYGGLVMDGAGDLYGFLGAGTFHEGAVGELIPGSGGWTYNALYSFGSQQGDGNTNYDGLTWDATGNLYGTNAYGGDPSCSWGCGTIFQLSPGSGGWQETVLHRFSGKDGQHPHAGVIFDRVGNLYTAASDGGGKNGSDYGNVFKLTPGSGGQWRGTVLHRFQNPYDGAAPVSTPVMDSAGNIYGTAGGGDHYCNGGCGVVYKLTPRAKGPWKYTILHTFHWSDGAYTDGGVILDSKGRLYGTTIEGGAYGGGVVYEITP